MEDLELIPVDEITDDEPKPPVVITPQPQETLLDKAAWDNVTALMKTQNEFVQEKLNQINPALSEIRETLTSTQNALSRLSTKIDELEAAKVETPEEVSTDEEIVEEKPAKRSALPWKR